MLSGFPNILKYLFTTFPLYLMSLSLSYDGFILTLNFNLLSEASGLFHLLFSEVIKFTRTAALRRLSLKHHSAVQSDYGMKRKDAFQYF